MDQLWKMPQRKSTGEESDQPVEVRSHAHLSDYVLFKNRKLG